MSEEKALPTERQSMSEVADAVAGEGEEWKPRRQEYLIMISLSLISLVVAVDASILLPALPVSFAYLIFQCRCNRRDVWVE
jgi:hypothetical protein